ncbi:hypothetical protein PG988_006573 [Apiospora saccharicola]
MPSKFRLSELFSRKRSGNIAAPSEVSTPPQISAPRTQSSTTTSTVPYGLEIVSEGDHPAVDIVAVHGLNGHREQTWVASNNTHWLRDLLPADIPNARIMSWGYDANTHSSSGISCQYLYDHARSLVSDLCRKRQLTDVSQRDSILY